MLLPSVFRATGWALGTVCLGLAAARAAEPLGKAGALREMATDRPDATESPFTVDPGHVQLEMDFANYTRDRSEGTRTIGREGAPFNLRFGVSRSVELGLFVTPYRRVSETPPGGPRETHSGFGDTTLRTKLNFSGNDEPRTGPGIVGTGLIVDLKLPTSPRILGNGKVEGEITLPVAFALPGGWDGGAMTSVGVAYTDGRHYRPIWTNTLTVGHDLTENLGGFAELTSSTGDGPHVATFNVGITRSLGPNTQLDCGANIGLSRSAPDLTLFAGLSQRF